MKIQHTCPYENCPRKNWPTQQKDMDLALQVLRDLFRSAMPKYLDYDSNKSTASEMITEWVEKLYDALTEYYPTEERRQQIFLNILLTLVEIYPDDGLPRKALMSCA